MKQILLGLVLMSQLGCQSMMYGTADELNNLKVGMTKADVLKKLGDPTSSGADSDHNEEYLLFKKMNGVVSWGPSMYKVTLRDGKVIKWGEQPN